MFTFKVAGKDWRFDEVPNTCPMCHRAIDARILVGVLREARPLGPASIELVFQCPHRECLRAFIGRFIGEYDHRSYDNFMRLKNTAPYTPAPPDHSAEVAEVSQQFVAVYAQAAGAEGFRLNEVAGCGYRKALEFLIKDFCILQSPEQAEAIKGKFLGKVIEDHVQDEGIKASAKRAAWLGNDETHYVRRWENKDINDLKRLIALTESWITTVKRTASYLADMPE